MKKGDPGRVPAIRRRDRGRLAGRREYPSQMAPAADGAGRDRGWLNSTETTRPGDKTDELSRGVFLLRKAPAPRRFTARKSFKPVVPDETVEGMERRHEAYVSCWRAADAHVSRVLADANADAFRRLEAFVVDRFDERAAMRAANGGETPQHLAQQIPAGLVLAGGVNSDDHEETFTKLTRHLRSKGCHAALLRSRDLKARVRVGFIKPGVPDIAGAGAEHGDGVVAHPPNHVHVEHRLDLLEREPGAGALTSGDEVDPAEGRGLDLFGLIGLLLAALLALEWVLYQRGRIP